jgi:hypothetical protein
MNIIFRLAERGDGGLDGQIRSGPPVMDLPNNRLRSNFILPIRVANTLEDDLVANFLPARRYICVMVTGGR